MDHTDQLSFAILVGLAEHGDPLVDADIDVGPIVKTVYDAVAAYLVTMDVHFRDNSTNTLYQPLLG